MGAGPLTVERCIQTPACLAEGSSYLARVEPRFSTLLELTGALPLRLRQDGFPALLSAIVSQQVSVAAADAIMKKLIAAKLTTPTAILRADEDTLRAGGLSRQKIRYLRALAEARVPFAKLRNEPTEVVIEKLTSIPGIGRWTAEIYAMFSLGRADVFAPGDLALQEAARILFELDEHPTEAELRRMAEDWSPWRAVAARALWAYYRVVKEREGIR